MARLRYPDEALLEETDYLQIQILNYTALGKKGNMLRGNRQAFKSGKGSAKQFLNSIFLPIPSNIQDGNSVSYADDTLDSLTARVYGAIKPDENVSNLGLGETLATTLKGSVDAITSADARRVFTASLAAQAANIPFGGNMSIGQILAREEGQILNPNMELLFNGVTLRSFKFSFKMTPRDTDEAKNIAHIISTLKKSMSPKGSGTFLQTPNIFQLTYKKGPKTHPYLNLFKQCFLTDMSVNYTGEGVYATYNDGSPVSYTMDLGFKEVEPIYAENYDNKADGNLVGF